jgi:hypothetical protein
MKNSSHVLVYSFSMFEAPANTNGLWPGSTKTSHFCVPFKFFFCSSHFNLKKLRNMFFFHRKEFGSLFCFRCHSVIGMCMYFFYAFSISKPNRDCILLYIFMEILLFAFRCQLRQTFIWNIF